MQIAFSNRNDKEYQSKLNVLLKDIFFDFQFWYNLDLWDENYESYSIIDKNEIISNICLYRTQIFFNNKQYSALSVGAVATKPAYRGNGLSRMLMEHIINKYANTPIYLSANDDVAGFYPKFGFERIYEKLPVCSCIVHNDLQPVKLSYDDPKVWNYIYKRVNFSKRLDCLNTAPIQIFHLYAGYLKDCIYELPELKTMVIAKQQGTVLKLTGVFSLIHLDFNDIIKQLPFKNIDKIEFGFMPDWPDLTYTMQEYDTDPLFVRALSCDLGDFKFPELSTT